MKTRNEKLNRRDKSAAALSAAVDRRSMIAAVSDSRTPSLQQTVGHALAHYVI